MSDVMTEDAKQAPPTHFLVPTSVFQALSKTLSTMPWDQVNQIMAALSECQPMAVLPKPPEDPST